ncbi:MAG: UDP-N-acetylmuramoyl-tripeptide--D-alanyl-D-alanine ligase [Deltaproteobacteria bacterium]|nr:MAG: UDP-N-acetylmuramoyl-tripeptide--D-alanyl-D-alanine ligase [Deltaproteobacteria bacterium]
MARAGSTWWNLTGGKPSGWPSTWPGPEISCWWRGRGTRRTRLSVRRGLSLTTGLCSGNTGLERSPWIRGSLSLFDGLVEDSVGLPSLDGKALRVTLDSREVGPGSLFIGVKGEKRDGSDFALEALERGADGVVVSPSRWEEVREAALASGKAALLAGDTTKFLGDLSARKGEREGLLKVGITGSAGKTTVKEMTYAVLSVSRKGYRSPGNFNNLIGLPLTLLSLNDDDQFLVAEMGTNVPGEIERLTEILRPSVGLITNVGPAHLEGLGDVEAVAREKGKLFEGVGEEGTVVVNADDERVLKLGEAAPGRKIFFGEKGRDVSGRLVSMKEDGMTVSLRYGGEEVEVHLPVAGVQYFAALLAAAGVAFSIGLPAEDVVRGASSFQPPEGRFRVEELDNGVVLVDDSYNANPLSFRKGFETLSLLFPGKPKVLVMGDMLELGEFSPRAHEEVGEEAASLSPEFAVVTGEMAAFFAKGLRRGGVPEESIVQVSTAEDAARAVLDKSGPGSVVYVKASRRVGLDKVCSALREKAFQGRSGE